MPLERARIEAYLSRLSGSPARIDHTHELGGAGTGAAALKAFGYGRPLRIDYRVEGRSMRVILRQVSRNGFGRERDSDRVAEVWLDFHAFNRLPRHAHARDMIALREDGELESIAHVEDLLLLTDFLPGHLYADDLLRARDEGRVTPLDVQRAAALASYLAKIHAVRHDDSLLWRRRLRDLVGHGEGIMGLADSYPPDFPLLTAEGLREIENAANAWRWRLKPLAHRLSQVHGDYHPFNVLFADDAEFHVLDRSRGEWGEPADDVSCMAINYLFFSLQRENRLAAPFVALYHAFWETYLAERPDDELTSVIQPWFAWRALVLASPQWYPTLEPSTRKKLLNFARRVMAEERFEWRQINRYLEA